MIESARLMPSCSRAADISLRHMPRPHVYHVYALFSLSRHALPLFYALYGALMPRYALRVDAQKA